MSGGTFRGKRPCRRRVDVAQQPVADPVMRDRRDRVVDVVQQLLRACVAGGGAGERNRVDRGEPADGSAQVDIRFENRPASPREVDRDSTGRRSLLRSCGRVRPAGSGRWATAASAGRRRPRRSARRVSVNDSLLIRSSALGGSVTSWSATRRVALVAYSSQKSRLSSTAGWVASAAQRCDHSRHVVVAGCSAISSPASRCPNAVKMSVNRMSREALSPTIACTAITR